MRLREIGLPSLDTLTDKVEIKGMGPDKEAFIIWVGCVTLNGWRLIKDPPVLSVFQTSFHE